MLDIFLKTLKIVHLSLSKSQLRIIVMHMAVILRNTDFAFLNKNMGNSFKVMKCYNFSMHTVFEKASVRKL